jgi:hypothetical protein
MAAGMWRVSRARQAGTKTGRAQLGGSSEIPPAIDFGCTLAGISVPLGAVDCRPIRQDGPAEAEQPNAAEDD